MSANNNVKTPNHDARNKVLIGLLAPILLLAIWSNFSGSTDSDETPIPENVSQTSLTESSGLPNAPSDALSSAGAGVQVQANGLQDAVPLPPVDMRLVLGHNPFVDRNAQRTDQVLNPSKPIRQCPTGFCASPDVCTCPVSPDDEPVIDVVPGPQNAVNRQTPAPPPPVAPPSAAVQAIISGGNRPAALIGDKVYHVGDVIEKDWRVKIIKENGVVFERTNLH